MRSEIRTALAVLATAAVLLGSATMAIAADGDGAADPAGTPSTATATASDPTADPTDDPTAEPTDEPTSEPTTEPTPEPTETTETPATTRTITDAQLRWGVNNESNNRAFAPGTFNFFSAGKIPNPGKGGVVLPQGDWKQSDGNVSIEKYLTSAGAYTPATYAGLRTTSAGTTMAGTGGPFSNHQVVLSGGSGTVDRSAGTASIQWTGSFTVLYYSGYSFSYVTDPKLTVANGVGTLTATLSGYGSSMDDLTKWEAIPPVSGVVLADMPSVDLTADAGFTATPAYRKVAVSVGSDQTPQVRSGDSWGSFPQSFVDYQLASGSGAYWYSSGGSADAHKPALPVTVSYSAASPVTVKAPSTKGPTTTDVDNDAPENPTDTPITSPGGLSPQLPAQAAPVVPTAADAVQAGSTLTQFRPASTVTGIRPVSGTSDTTGIWLLGGILLAASALLAASPFAYAAVRKAG